MSLNKLSLLVIASLAFTACDGDETVPASEGNTQAGTMVGGITAGTQAGTMTAGTMTAGTMTAGVMTGGTTPAGMEAGVMTAGVMTAGTQAGTMTAGTMTAGTDEPRMGLGDTDPLECMGSYCPSARLSALTIPADAAAATTGGCRLAGSSNGASLGGLLALAGGAVDTNSFVQPDENGEISLILLNHLKGWADGATGNSAGELDAQFFTGVQSGVDTFDIDPVSLQGDGSPYISFPGTTVTDGLLSTPTSTFTVNLPILDGVNLGIRLDQAKLEGDLSIKPAGFELNNGVLGGYLTTDGIMELINGLIAACTSPMPPDALSSVCPIIGTDANVAFGLLTTFVTLDTAVNGDAPAASCSGADCNALSVCLLVGMTPVTVSGIASGK